MNFTLRQLRAFVSVAKLGSFTRAARSLHVSQPALTVQIRQLEEAMGVRLLDRNTRSVALSQVGREFAPVLERILGEIDAVASNARELTSRKRGIVTIAALPSVSATLLPVAIATFKSEHPGITVRLRDAVAQRVSALVKSREVDFGISSATQPDPEIRTTPLFADRMSVVFPPAHPIGRSSRVTLHELTRFPLILMDPETSVRALVDRAFESIGYSAVPAYEAAYMATLIGMVKAGLGIAILPSATALEGGQLTGLSVRTIEHEKLTRQISIIQSKGRSPSPAAEDFVRTLHKVCKTLRF